MTFGEKLEELLDWSGTSQRDLANRSRISQSSISDYIRGKSIPTIDVAQKLAAALNVSLWTLLNGSPLSITPMDLTAQERALVNEFRRLDPEAQDAYYRILEIQNRNKP